MWEGKSMYNRGKTTIYNGGEIMSRFVSCGKLRCQFGGGFKLPDFLRPKDGIFRGNITITNDMLDKNGRLVFKLKEVTGRFRCDYINISSLEGAPETVGEDFLCTNNSKVTSLKGAPKTVGGDFWCTNNPKLTSLKGAPETVVKNFWCTDTNISSLKGAPKTVGEDFWCNDTPKLTSLKGAPKTVVKNFYIQNAGRKFTEEEVRAVCDVKGKVYV